MSDLIDANEVDEDAGGPPWPCRGCGEDTGDLVMGEPECLDCQEH